MWLMVRSRPIEDRLNCHLTRNEIVNIINDHYTESCTLKQIADSIGYDYVYLSKLFQKTINLSYTKYLNSFRISKARELLKNTSLPVTDIAFNVGYENLRTFNRNFKDVTGNTPAQYRKSSKVTKYDKAIQENYISG
ncbi:helix-turn-helix domain-containing protein [Lentilactobacillus buchneri]|uniref:helix-turn-helix domain-containing protein n=2 Tax=Lentilactobacillus buchneri TaxID=1581 RepID=UPI002852C59C|nr:MULTISPECIES: AraC family transcriptional regulator [Lentilactobacillus]